MSKKDDQLYAQLMAYIAQMQNQPKPANPAQDRLTAESLKGMDWLQGRDFRDMKGAGAFFDFEQPGEQNTRRTQITNANQSGTFGLANNSGETKATGLQSKYLADKFARDTAQNFQSNVSGAAQNVRAGLVQSSGAAAGDNQLEQNRRLAALSAMTNMYAHPQQSNGIWGSILGLGAGVAAAV